MKIVRWKLKVDMSGAMVPEMKKKKYDHPPPVITPDVKNILLLFMKSYQKKNF